MIAPSIPSAPYYNCWLAQVRRGVFEAIPEQMTWLQSARLCSLWHCYLVSDQLGLGELAFWANERADEAAAAGEWRGTAIELLLCLCFEHRRYRHFGFEPTGADRSLIDQLEALVRARLIELPAPERAKLAALPMTAQGGDG